MTLIRFVIFTLIATFLVHPIGSTGASAHERATQEDLTISHEVDWQLPALAVHSDNREKHLDTVDQHNLRDTCCSSSGVCTAVLVQDARSLEPEGAMGAEAGVFQALMSRTVDTLLHPPNFRFYFPNPGSRPILDEFIRPVIFEGRFS